MTELRFVITDRVWEKIAPYLPGKVSDCGVTAADNRLFLEAVLWRGRTGAPWRDLPPGLGNWNSCFQRFRRWAKKGVFERLFETLSEEPDLEYALIDGTIVSVHQKASGAKRGTQNQAIGRSKGGLTTKIVALVDALGALLRFVLLPGQRHDMIGVATVRGHRLRCSAGRQGVRCGLGAGRSRPARCRRRDPAQSQPQAAIGL